MNNRIIINKRQQKRDQFFHMDYRRLLSAVMLLVFFIGLYSVAYEERSGYAALKINNGMLDQIVPYSNMRDPGYTNVGSDILRYCVYVETDHDTDGDGMADLVKVFVQVPYPAVTGKYKAASIYDPTPYGVGTVAEASEGADPFYVEKKFNYDNLYKSGEKRVPVDEWDTVTAANNANPFKDWNYVPPLSDSEGYPYSESYDYFLVRGYAIIQAAGIGTYGSEGFELCGTDLERDSHKCVVEWLAGNRIAYTNRTDNIEIKADWSNGSVAMTGTSYGGTLPYEVATTGVEGLKTIIPFAGIASWYDYTNSQGISTFYHDHYKDYLSCFNCGGTFHDDDWLVPDDDYGSWLWTVAQDEAASHGDYSPIWEASDYSQDYQNIKCSALIVHGLNDFNVLSKQSDLMYQAFSKAKAPVKLFFHQNGHFDLYEYMIGDEPWYEIMNKWLAHYLYDVDNGIENMPELTVQSNIDGSFSTYDKWRDFDYQTMSVETESKESQISTNGLSEYFGKFFENKKSSEFFELLEDYFLGLPKEAASIYEIDVPDNCTISGVPKINLSCSTDTEEYNGLMISAILVDTAEEGSTFSAFMLKDRLDNCVPRRTVAEFSICDELMPWNLYEHVQNTTAAKCFSFGWTDLYNPGLGYDSSEYVKKTSLEAGKYYDYTIYMQPTVYTVAPGHHLKLVLTAWDPYRKYLDDDFELDIMEDVEEIDYNYSFTIDNTSINVELPVIEN